MFLGRPAERLSGTLRLKSSAEGTDILYGIEVIPKSTSMRALNDLLVLLDGSAVVLEPLPDALSRAEAASLKEITSRMPDPVFAAALARFIDEAPLSEQDDSHGRAPDR